MEVICFERIRGRNRKLYLANFSLRMRKNGDSLRNHVYVSKVGKSLHRVNSLQETVHTTHTRIRKQREHVYGPRASKTNESQSSYKLLKSEIEKCFRTPEKLAILEWKLKFVTKTTKQKRVHQSQEPPV